MDVNQDPHFLNRLPPQNHTVLTGVKPSMLNKVENTVLKVVIFDYVK
jgi:hypothetical protein